MIVIFHIIWSLVKEIKSKIFSRETVNKGVQFDSKVKEKLDCILNLAGTGRI